MPETIMVTFAAASTSCVSVMIMSFPEATTLAVWDEPASTERGVESPARLYAESNVTLMLPPDGTTLAVVNAMV